MKIPFHTALITGSSRGIGRGIAVKLAREGVKKIAVQAVLFASKAGSGLPKKTRFARSKDENGCILKPRWRVPS